MRLKTRPPFKFFFWIIASLLFTIYLAVAGMVLWGALFYGLFGIVMLYWIISNKDCRIILDHETLEVSFHRTFWKKKTFSVKKIDQLEFIKGEPGWKLFFVSKVEQYYRSLDKLIIISGGSHHEILINTNRHDLGLLIDHFNKGRRTLDE